MGQELQVRLATPGDAAAIIDLSRRVQAKLTASGSQQQIGPIPADVVLAHVAGGSAYVLDRNGVVIGSLFVEPADVGAPTSGLLAQLQEWGFGGTAGRIWYLQKFMIASEEQGHGLGNLLLEGALAHVVSFGAATVVLDCWAGNHKLRDFYRRAGFRLQGVFPVRDFEVAVFVRSLGVT